MEEEQQEAFEVVSQYHVEGLMRGVAIHLQESWQGDFELYRDIRPTVQTALR